MPSATAGDDFAVSPVANAYVYAAVERLAARHGLAVAGLVLQ